MKKKLLCLLLCVSIFTVGCAGTAPNPISMYYVGDENKGCNALKAEIAGIDKQVQTRVARQNSKGWTNTIYFVTGWFIIVPWFFIDVKGAEQVEIDAYQQRKDALLVMAAEKNCGSVETD